MESLPFIRDECGHLQSPSRQFKTWLAGTQQSLLGRGQEKLFTNEKVKIKNQAIKTQPISLPSSRAIPDSFLQHFAECPVIVFGRKILISPLFFSSLRGENGVIEKGEDWRRGILYNEILVTECLFSLEWYNFATPFITLRHIERLCQGSFSLKTVQTDSSKHNNFCLVSWNWGYCDYSTCQSMHYWHFSFLSLQFFFS